ncbi:C-type lectin domain family 2 member D-like isoform X2 [Choloepus didactylus]|uniref:C-type lectin domain family 2 member D-like isoform X2 n=1 Tax=Choloepus didactylus TaxID=27675 RepID=UPI0018A076D6|nr:C-type lectin domain family 2 member D-like isoform X2 [Choloepus didactylus]
MHETSNVDKDFIPTELLANPGYLPSEKGSHNSILKRVFVSPLVICLSLTIVLCGMVTTALVATVKFHRKPPECLEVACPDNWIGFQRKCFYFSFDTKNWTSSQRYCDSQGADLVQVETSQEMEFLLRYKGPSDHWTGLSREQGQPWKWTNGDEFTGWFHIRGGGECAYLNDKGYV